MPDPAIWRRLGRGRPYRRSEPDRLSHPAPPDARPAALARTGRPPGPAARLRDPGPGPRRPEEAVTGWDCARMDQRPRPCPRRRRRWTWTWVRWWGGRSG